MKVTYVDTGIFMWAVTGDDERARAALDILDDPDRQLVASFFVRLEILPKPIYQKMSEQVAEYLKVFAAVPNWVEPDDRLLSAAYTEACVWGLGALDACHVAAALRAKAEEFVTTERPEKAIHRCKSLQVVSVHP